jgi:hypothetical protein
MSAGQFKVSILQYWYVSMGSIGINQQLTASMYMAS